jgi:hypothetical protein
MSQVISISGINNGPWRDLAFKCPCHAVPKRPWCPCPCKLLLLFQGVQERNNSSCKALRVFCTLICQGLSGILKEVDGVLHL